MASKVGYSEHVGLPELITVLKEFERTNSVEIVTTSRIVEANGRKDWQWELMAFDAKAAPGEVRLLASAKRLCMESRLVTVEALLLQLLYTLDFELGLLELQKADATK